MVPTITLGDVTIQRIVEEERPLFDPLEFFPTLTKEVLEENLHWLQPKAIDPVTGKMILPIQSYLVRTKHHTILVDTCVGNHKPRPARAFWNMKDDPTYLRNLAAAGVSPDEIDYVMCTHLHVDHVGWNTRLENGRWVPTFPKAKYVFSRGEFDYWTAENAKAEIGPIADSVLPIVAARQEKLVPNDFALDDIIRLEPTLGHSIDHVAVHVTTKAGDIIMTGDMVHSPIQMLYPDISMRIDYDAKQSAETRWKFFECYCETSTLMAFGHFPSPSFGRIKRWGKGFRSEEVTP
jgi:glyoxylase-like metal-dependent hydrolase (beta-lactamase superfamily II)